MDIGTLFTDIAGPSRVQQNAYAQAIQKSRAAERLASKSAAANSSAQSALEQPAWTVTISSKAENYSLAQQTLSSLPPEAVEEAKRRMANDNGLVVEKLAMLPENKALYDEITKEINACTTDSERARLSHIRQGLERCGWREPMTREQAAFEEDVFNARAALNTLSGGDDAYYDGLNKARLSVNLNDGYAPDKLAAAEAQYDKEWFNSRPEPARYAEKGLTMPKVTAYDRLPAMAKAAGIGDEEFAATAREYAKTMGDPELYCALEQFISDRYTGKAA